MSETHLFLWAKKHGTGDGEVWHPLLYHMIDVGVVAEELWHRALHHYNPAILRHRTCTC